MKIRNTLPSTASALTALVIAGCQLGSHNDYADAIYHSGNIYTMDDGRTWAKAVAIKNGEFMAVGENTDIFALSGPDTELHDLQGAMAMPGLQDSHFHTMGVSHTIDCSPGAFKPEKLREILNYCKTRQVEGHPWLIINGFELWEAEKVNNSLLNEIFPDTPVIIRDLSYHTIVVNDKALSLAGIDNETPQPEGGVILKDPQTGKPTGALAEPAAIKLVTDLIPPYSDKVIEKAYINLFEKLLEQGITSLQDGRIDRTSLEMLSKLDRMGTPMPYIVSHLSWYYTEDEDQAKQEKLISNRTTYDTPHVRTDGIKLYLDGVPVPPAFTHVPVDEHNQVDERNLLIPRQVLDQKLIEWDAAGLKVKMHAAGEGSVRVGLDAIEAARQTNGQSGILHELGHSSDITAQDFPRFAQLQATAELSPYFWHLGPPMGNTGYQFRTLYNSNSLITIGSDFPVVDSFNPFPPLQGIVERGEESLPIATALEFVTRNGAESINRQAEMGSIEAGKIANMVVLDRNLLEIPSHQIGDTQVVKTILDGQLVYQQKP